MRNNPATGAGTEVAGTGAPDGAGSGTSASRTAIAATDRSASRPVTPAQTRVAQSLLMAGPASVVDLAGRLDITPAAVRRHIDALVSQGFVLGGERPAYGPSPSRGRGRPPKIFSLTDEGRDVFDQAYDDLAVAALQFLREQVGEHGVAEFAAKRGRDFEQRYAATVAAAGPECSDRASALATALTRDGFAAVVDQDASGIGIQICQHNCPVAHVAAEFPVLCEKETEAMQRLLGGTVTRLATIAHGDGVCTAVAIRRPSDIPEATTIPDTTTVPEPATIPGPTDHRSTDPLTARPSLSRSGGHLS